MKIKYYLISWKIFEIKQFGNEFIEYLLMWKKLVFERIKKI
jgi:hypothetical protein